MLEKEEILKRIPIFSQLDRVDLAKLVPELEEVKYQAGETIFKQGEQGSSLLVITGGKARVFIHNPQGAQHDLAILGSYECLGEMALLTGEPRSASVQAETDISALKLERSRFDRLQKDHPFLSIHLNRVMAQRLASTNQAAASGTVYSKDNDVSSLENGFFSVESSANYSVISHGIRQVWIWLKSLLDLKHVGALILVTLCSWGLFCVLNDAGFNRDQIIIALLLWLAAAAWSTNILSFNVISMSLPVAAVLLGVSDAQRAFIGYSSSSWFLMLSILAIAVAMNNTGLLYRVGLWTTTKFSPFYANQTLALTVSGLLLTPIIPSADGRTALAGTLAMDLVDTLGLKDRSSGAVGIAMACMLGFGQMSFLFMNGSTTCVLVFGLMPDEVASTISWGYWLRAALPLGIFYLIFSWLTILFFYREKIEYKTNVIASQLKILGPPTKHEIIAVLVVGLFLIGELTQSLHHINSAWVAIIAFLLLFGTSVLDESSVRKDIDWNRLISYGALVGFGVVIQQSGFTDVLASKAVHPLFQILSSHTALFLFTIAIFVNLLRIALPVVPALVLSTLTLIPIGSLLGVNPLVIALIILLSSNSWILPYQSTIYQNLVMSTEDRVFQHKQTLKFAYSQVAVILLSIAINIPYWRFMGLVK
ncbi:MAG: SLC13 family permease [Syntrophomonadaceae bacterium]